MSGKYAIFVTVRCTRTGTESLAGVASDAKGSVAWQDICVTLHGEPSGQGILLKQGNSESNEKLDFNSNEYKSELNN